MSDKKSSTKNSTIRTIAFIAAILLIMAGIIYLVKPLTSTPPEKLEGKIDLSEEVLSEYDGQMIYGSTVVSFISSLTNETITISVDNGMITATYKSYESTVKDKTSDSYIAPGDRYRCTLERNQNRDITQIVFTKENQ